MEAPNLTATFDGDSKRYHRFICDEWQEIVGTIHVPGGEGVPDMVEIQLCTKWKGLRNRAVTIWNRPGAGISGRSGALKGLKLFNSWLT